MAVDAGKVALNPRGVYSSTTTYERLDVVTYQSNTYVALQTTLGNLPTDTSSWMALVKVDNASMSVRGLVKVDGTSITADADGTIHGHAAAGVNSFNGRDGDVLPEYGDYDAESIAYDNTDSGLTSNRAQGAIDELTPKKIITSDDAFDPTKTYAVGDWLIHQGVLYEVITACTGITPPNATYYEPQTISALISELEESTPVNITPVSSVVSEMITNLSRKNGIVFGRIIVTLNSPAHSGWLFIGTIDIRPKYDFWGVCVNAETVGYSGVYQIMANGIVRIYVKDSPTVTALVGICYEA